MTLEDKVDTLARVLKKYMDTQSLRTKTSTINFFSERGGQIQFGIIPPRYEVIERDGKSSRVISRDGAVLVEGAPPNPEKPGYLDWENKKVTFSLGDKDIGDILYALSRGNVNKNGELVSLYHKNVVGETEVGKTFKIKPGEQNSSGQSTFLVEISDVTNKRRVSIFVTGADLMRLEVGLRAALPLVLGWIG